MSKCVVVASGYFNPLHYGHVSYLQRAREAGTSLIVIVNNDRQAMQKLGSVEAFQAKGIPARDRVRLVRSLACVDAAIEAVDEDESVAQTIRMLHPDVFANGGKQHATPKEVEACQELGIRMIDGLGIEMLLLQPFTQHYDWGKPKPSSVVAALGGKHMPTTPTMGFKPYAELWMGDHPSGPSRARMPGDSVGSCLMSTLKSSPCLLGKKLAEEAQLPFLLKVLSIEKALSIQAHPDRALAAKLHAERPDVYKDPNHKPEIAIALTDFEALCGFRMIPDILELVDAVPELASIVGPEATELLRAAVVSGDEDDASAALKQAYCVVMRSNEEVVSSHLRALVGRASAPPPSEGHKDIVAKAFMLVRRLFEQFGADIGIFSVFFLNFAEMKVGECLYMPQNTPHAYLSGDIVECMACSDNVVRGGLTLKYKDLDVLCDMLVYKGAPPPTIAPDVLEPGMKLYAHKELDEFQVTHLKLTAGSSRRYCFSGQGPALGFAFKGHGNLRVSGENTRLESGVVFLLAAGVDADISAEEELDIFVASCPPHYFHTHTTEVLRRSATK